MTTINPITPPPELVASLRNSAPHGIRDAGVTRELWLINKAYAAGADQELEACCLYLERNFDDWDNRFSAELRAARRPKPPSLKEQALAELEEIMTELHDETGSAFTALTIRRALETLDD